jgi:hypothetical protein
LKGKLHPVILNSEFTPTKQEQQQQQQAADANAQNSSEATITDSLRLLKYLSV